MEKALNIYWFSGCTHLVKTVLNSSGTFVHTNNPDEHKWLEKFLFKCVRTPKNNLVHTNPELPFSISGKVRIVRRKQMKHERRFIMRIPTTVRLYNVC